MTTPDLNRQSPTADHLAHAEAALERRDALLGIGHALVAIGQTLRDSHAKPAVAAESDYVPQIRPGLTVAKERPVESEPALGEQVTDSDGDVWQRWEDGWRWWMGEEKGGWSPEHCLWSDMQTDFALRDTIDADRRRVGLPGYGEDTPPASQNGPQDARSADSGTGGPPEPESGAQGRIGWLRLEPGDDCRCLALEVPGGWDDTDSGDDLFWSAENLPDAEFEPIRTLADDEVAVKRGDLRKVLDMVWIHESVPAAKRESVARLRAALEAGR